MKLIRHKNTIKTISMLWLIGILSSCGSYHKLKNINGNYKTVLESESKNDSKVYFVHTNNLSCNSFLTVSVTLIPLTKISFEP